MTDNTSVADRMRELLAKREGRKRKGKKPSGTSEPAPASESQPDPRPTVVAPRVLAAGHPSSPPTIDLEDPAPPPKRTRREGTGPHDLAEERRRCPDLRGYITSIFGEESSISHPMVAKIFSGQAMIPADVRRLSGEHDHDFISNGRAAACLAVQNFEEAGQRIHALRQQCTRQEIRLTEAQMEVEALTSETKLLKAERVQLAEELVKVKRDSDAEILSLREALKASSEDLEKQQAELQQKTTENRQQIAKQADKIARSCLAYRDKLLAALERAGQDPSCVVDIMADVVGSDVESEDEASASEAPYPVLPRGDLAPPPAADPPSAAPGGSLLRGTSEDLSSDDVTNPRL